MAISCDPSALAQQAKCFKCLTPDSIQQVKTYLLCQYVNKGGSPPAPPSCGTATNWILIAGAGTAAANGVYETADGGTTFVNAASGYFIVRLFGVGGFEAALYRFDATLMYSLPSGELFPCGTWAVNGGTGPAPTASIADYGVFYANEWAARVVTNGGVAPAQTTINAAATFLNGLNSAGLVNKMIAINIVAPDNLTAAATPLIKGPGNDPWTTVGTLNLTYDGIMPSAATSYYRTGIIPSTAYPSNGNCGLTAYIGSICSHRYSFIALGAQKNASADAAVLQLSDFSNSRAAAGLPSNTTPVTVANFAGMHGYWSGNCTATNARALYFKGPVTAHQAVGTDSTNQAAIPLPAFEIYACANNVSGVATNTAQPSKGRISFFAVHQGLTVTESATFCTLIENLRKSLGGGYIDSTADSASTLVTNWVNRVVAQGGSTPAAATQTALTTFWNALIAAGIHTKMCVIMPMTNDGLTAALMPFFRTVGPTQWTNNNFVAGDLTVNGLIGNGSTKNLLGMFNSGDIWFPSGSFGITYYDVTGTSENKRMSEWHPSSGAGNGYGLINYGTTMFAYGGVATGNLSGAAGAFQGYLSCNRITLSDFRGYKANSGTAHVEVANNTSAIADSRISDDTNPAVIPLFSAYINATMQDYSSHRVSFYALHYGLTAAESTNFFNAIQALRTSLGGGYI